MRMSDKEKILKAFGAKVREARKKKGFSQEELSFESGFDRTYISFIERGKRNPSLTTIYKIAEALKVEADSIFPSVDCSSNS